MCVLTTAYPIYLYFCKIALFQKYIVSKSTSIAIKTATNFRVKEAGMSLCRPNDNEKLAWRIFKVLFIFISCENEFPESQSQVTVKFMRLI